MSERRMFFRDVAPSVMAFALSGVYTIVDGFFVGNSLGDSGLAAINLGFRRVLFRSFYSGCRDRGRVIRRHPVHNPPRAEKGE